jgi:DNA polymerase III delta subunit
MKFQQWELFEGHLKEALSRHLSPIFALSVKEDEERRLLLDQIKELLRGVEGADILFAKTVEEAALHLQTISLFGTLPIALFDGDCAPFSDFLPKEKSHLILASSESKPLQVLYTKHKREMVWLDLTGEKPWEKKPRLERYAVKQLQSAGKRFSGATIEALISRAGGHTRLLESEIHKLLCYVGTRDEVTPEDVRAIGIPVVREEGFALAEEILWGKSSQLAVSDLSLLLPLIGQLRYLLEQGLVISALKEQGKSSHEIGDELPKLAPRMIDKVLKKLGGRRSSFFVNGLKALFALELGAKNSEATPQILFDRFRAHLQ